MAICIPVPESPMAGKVYVGDFRETGHAHGAAIAWAIGSKLLNPIRSVSAKALDGA